MIACNTYPQRSATGSASSTEPPTLILYATAFGVPADNSEHTMNNKPRAILYLRQSISREDSISLELQETAGRAHAKQQGYQVVGVESDPGISGRTWNRPAVQRVMAMIEAKEADVIVLWKWSRLSRSRLDWAVAADKVETAGGRIESATEPLDVSTSTGRLARGMLTEFAAFESERIGDVWKEAHARRVAQGRPANGKPRFGYAYTREAGFTPDPISGPVLTQAYRRYITGESFYSLTAWLNDGPTRPVTGYGPQTNGYWTTTTIRRVMDNGFAAGYFTRHGERVQGIHEALITEQEWDEYQVRRDSRRVHRSGEKSEYLLTGLVFCALCGSGMYANIFGHDRTVKYRCSGVAEKRIHTGGYMMASALEADVFIWIQGLAEEITLAAKAQPTIKHTTTDPTPRLRRALIKVESRLDTLTLRLLDGTVPQDAYERTRDTLLGERRGIEVQLRVERVELAKPAPALVPDLVANWDLLPLHARRDMLKRLIARVEVTPGRPRGTTSVIPLWAQ